MAYIILRKVIPNVEANKTLDSDIMGSMGYKSAANKRYYVWTVAILAGVFNLFFLVIVCYLLTANGLYLFRV